VKECIPELRRGEVESARLVVSPGNGVEAAVEVLSGGLFSSALRSKFWPSFDRAEAAYNLFSSV